MQADAGFFSHLLNRIKSNETLQAEPWWLKGIVILVIDGFSAVIASMIPNYANHFLHNP